LSPTMANFALNPDRWVPVGHQIIDGGPTRLPRTFYNASVQPPRCNDHICVAILMSSAPHTKRMPEGSRFTFTLLSSSSMQ
jgi:hypothetical protein